MNSIAKRLSEPSSWAGLGGILAAVGLSVPSATLQAITLLGAGLASVAAIVIPEGK